MSEKPDLGFNQYPTQKKSKVNKWIKIGVPVLILVIIVAVLAGVFGSRAAKKQDSTLSANSDAAASSEANAQSSIRAELGRFATATDEYFLPVYPSTVSAHLQALLHYTSHVIVRSWQRPLVQPGTRFACVPGSYEMRPLTLF
jgi:hypothetical protein